MFAATAMAADPVVDRQGSELHVTWTSADAGSWDLRTTDGHICASGRTTQGQNHVDLTKLAAPTDVVFRTSSLDGVDDSLNIQVPGVKKLSTLPKPARAVTIYQVAPRTYAAQGNGAALAGKLSDMTTDRLREIRDLGIDYLWLTGVLEHAARAQTDPDVVKGEAGSYYAIYDNWDVSSEIGTMADFEAVIERAHSVGLRVLIDFVANHTARLHRTDVVCKQHLDFGRGDRTEVAFDRDNNYYYMPNTSFTPPTQTGSAGSDGAFDTDIFTPGIQLESPARVTGNDIVSPNPPISDWFETVKLNYGWDLINKRANYSPRPRTWNQMIDVARYWVEKGVDGFRVDFAHAVPIEFWRTFAAELKAVQPQVFLLAEAYETDYRMKLPGFTFYDMLDAGFDSVYNSAMYWAMHNQVQRPGDMRSAVPNRSPALAANIVNRGFQFTQYLENHDEERVASRTFAPWIGERAQRAELGLAYTAYLGLMPGNLLMHGGQELQEDASVFGSYAGDNGKTSIFDYVYQSQTRLWQSGNRPQWMIDFRQRYRDLLALKRLPAFSAIHKESVPSLVDLDGPNNYKEQSNWISSYIRFQGNDAYLVVTNGDPFVAHAATIHFTSRDNDDMYGAMRALHVENSTRRYIFKEVFARKDWVPSDPATGGQGLPGWALYKSGNIPSGLFLGDVPAATTYVFKVSAL